MNRKINYNIFKYLFIQYTCETCSTGENFWEEIEINRQIGKIRSGGCKHMSINFISNVEGDGKFKYSVSFTCGNCGKNLIRTLFDNNSEESDSFCKFGCCEKNEKGDIITVTVGGMLSQTKIEDDFEQESRPNINISSQQNNNLNNNNINNNNLNNNVLNNNLNNNYINNNNLNNNINNNNILNNNNNSNNNINNNNNSNNNINNNINYNNFPMQNNSMNKSVAPMNMDMNKMVDYMKMYQMMMSSGNDLNLQMINNKQIHQNNINENNLSNSQRNIESFEKKNIELIFISTDNSKEYRIFVSGKSYMSKVIGDLMEQNSEMNNEDFKSLVCRGRPVSLFKTVEQNKLKDKDRIIIIAQKDK